MNENMNYNPYERVYAKINGYRNNSYDINFHLYLDRKMREASRGVQSPNDMEREIDENYEKYLDVEKARSSARMDSGVQSGRPLATGVIPPQYTANNYTQNPYNNSVQYVAAPYNTNPYNTQQYGNQPNGQMTNNLSPKKKTPNEVEFKIGAGVLSVVGAVFLLIALFSFGRYFLKDTFQGVILYIVAVLVILLSELLLEKNLPKFAHIVTGIGIGSLYFITIFCTEYLSIFNIWVALGVSVAISIGAFLISKLRRSGAIELICCIGCSIMAIPYREVYVGELEYILYASILVLVYFAMFMVPIKQGNRVFKIIQLVALFIYGNFFLAARRFVAINPITLSTMAVLIVLLCLTCYMKNRDDKPVKYVSLVAMFEFLIYIISRVYRHQAGEIAIIELGVVCLLFIFLMFKTKDKWVPYSIFMLTATIAFFEYDNLMIRLLVILGILIISKLLSAVKELCVIDAIISVFAVALITTNTDEPLTYIYYLVLLLGMIMTVKWKLFHQFLFLYAGVAFIVTAFSGYLEPIICMAFIFVMVLVNNLVPTLRVKYIQVYNIISMIVLGLTIVGGTLHDYAFFEELAVNISALLIGCAAIICFFTEKFQMKNRCKYLILAFFITYMSFMFNTSNIWTSIILMIAALTIITSGFVFNRIELRIYGLALSLCMCLKLSLFDFRFESELNRMIVFLVVGIVAISISFIYLVLERKEQKEQQKEQQKLQSAMSVDQQREQQDETKEAQMESGLESLEKYQENTEKQETVTNISAEGEVPNEEK